ncbi:MAG: hypothetical protein ABI398_07115, partial [Devosia sp.]
MNLRRGKNIEFTPRHWLSRVLAGFLLLILTAVPAQATLLPEGFFDMVPAPGNGPAAVEADRMSYDGATDAVAAEGRVVMHFQGYVLRADQVLYDQVTGSVRANGDVTIRDPGGNIYQMDSIEITGGMKKAFINSLTLTTSSGARITAHDANFDAELQTILSEATYSPCGLCIDSKGR